MASDSIFLCDMSREDGRAGDADDCEQMASQKKYLSSTSGSSSLSCANGMSVPAGKYVRGRISFSGRVKIVQKVFFSALVASPFVKLHQHIRIGALYVTSGEPIVFALRKKTGLVSFLRPGIFPVNDQSFFLIADRCWSLCLISV